MNMVLCIVSLFVFGILGIFSAKYRGLAREAFRCTFNIVTLRPCEAGLDQKIKMGIVTRTSAYPQLSGFIYRHYGTISSAFTIIFLASLLTAAYGLYNYLLYGSCDPSGGACLFKQQYYESDHNGKKH